jgi:hypothetical protein
MTPPLVSVVTATWQRPAEIVNAVRQVRAQTYRPLEHVIVSDGPDPELRGLLAGAAAPGRDVPVVFAECGRHWSGELALSVGAAPFMVAQFLAHGPVQMWLSDDEEMDPAHIALLVDLLEASDSDFVYSRAEWWVPGHPEMGRVIGTVPPRPEEITNALYRTALLDYGTFMTHVGRGTDWHQISRWIDAGASYAMSPHVTFRHRADQLGGEESNRLKQPLRGLGGRGEYVGGTWKGLPLDPQGRPQRVDRVLL